MKKLILGCFLFTGFAAAETSASRMMTTTASGCDPEDMAYVLIETSCGPTAIASGCTTEEVIADTLSWEEFYCGPTIMP
ncbi:MAG: hypothetical protein ACQEW9_08270 [Bacteroidota bacterium]